jgi:hypothetical protein
MRMRGSATDRRCPWPRCAASGAALRATIIANRMMSEVDLDHTLSACRMHLTQPATSFTMYWVAQVWGRKPI